MLLLALLFRCSVDSRGKMAKRYQTNNGQSWSKKKGIDVDLLVALLCEQFSRVSVFFFPS